MLVVVGVQYVARDVTITGIHAGSDGPLLVSAESVGGTAPVDFTSDDPKPGKQTDPRQVTPILIVIEEDGQWKVDGVADVDTGGAPPR